MKFTMHRNRTIASTCGLSIEFEKGVARLVPPAMYAEVLAAGGVPEEELPEDEAVKTKSPEGVAERTAALNKAFAAIVQKNEPTEFTAGGAPHVGVVTQACGFKVDAAERDTAWVAFQQGQGAV